jgi:hypothetical protein
MKKARRSKEKDAASPVLFLRQRLAENQKLN